jgi:hypothetical protein
MARPDRSSRRRRPHRSLALLVAVAAAVAGAPAQGQPGVARPAVLTGALADQSARPLGHYPVQACLATTCYFGETSADGRFRFDLRLPVPTRLAIKTLEEADARPRRAAALAPVLVDGRPGIDAGTVYVLDLPDTPLARLTGGAQVVNAGDGLSLRLPAAGLTPPAGRALTGIAARRLPSAQMPRYELPAGERVIAVYVFHPFGTASRSPMGVQVASGLDAGSRVRFRTIGELDGSFSEPAGGSATGTHVVTNPGAGISQLTHLVITQ